MTEIPWQIRAMITGVGMGIVTAFITLAVLTLPFVQSLPAGYPVAWYHSAWFVWSATGAIGMMVGVATSIFCWKLERRGARRDAGECLACGYLLTANVSGVCPECGDRNEPEAL